MTAAGAVKASAVWLAASSAATSARNAKRAIFAVLLVRNPKDQQKV